MKKKILLFLIMIMLIPSHVFAKEEIVKQFTNDNITVGGYLSSARADGKNYVVVGQDDSKSFIVKYDKDDKIIKTVELENNVVYKDIEYLEDGGYILAGYKFDTKVSQITRLNKNLDVVWSKNYDGILELWDVEIYNDGSYAAVGEKDTYGCVIKVDKNGNKVWENVSLYADSKFIGLTIAKDQAVLAVGKADMMFDNLASKFDKNGKRVWEYILSENKTVIEKDENLGTIYVDRSFEQGFFDAVEDDNGDFILVGQADRNYLEYASASLKSGSGEENLGTIYVKPEVPIIAKLDKNGKLLFVDSYDIGTKPEVVIDGSVGRGITFTDITKTNDGYYVTACLVNINGDKTKEVNKIQNEGENLGAVFISYAGEAAFIKYDDKLNVEYQYVVKNTDTREVYYDVDMLDGSTFIGVGYEKHAGGYTLDFFTNKAIPNVIKVNINYDITKEETKNGEFDVIKEDDKATITSTPNEGFEIDTVVVKNSKGEEVEVTKNEDGSYTYDITDDTWVTVTFKEIPPIPENPKTGVFSYLKLFGCVVIFASVIIYSVKQNEIFKKF